MGTSSGIFQVAPGDPIVKPGLRKDGCTVKCLPAADSQLVISKQWLRVGAGNEDGLLLCKLQLTLVWHTAGGYRATPPM